MPRAPSHPRFCRARRDPVVVTALLVAVCVTILGGCTKPAPPRAQQAPTKIRVAAATDLRSCLDALTDELQGEHPNFDLLPTFGASGVLLTQLKSGLETDLYLSADVAYAHDLAAAGLAAEAGLPDGCLGRITLFPKHSLVDVPEQFVGQVIDRTRNARLRGRPFRMDVDRGPA